MPNRVATLRSSAPGVLPQPGTRLPGELWLNFADFALGFIDASQTAQKILAVRWFVPTTSYAVGDFVLQGGNLYRAIAPSSAGAFVAANWSKVGTAADLTAMQAYVDAGDALRVPLAGGTMSGPLILNADPTAALGATTKQYVDLRSGAVTVSATPPASPNPGALWWDSVGGQLYVWYVDPSTSQWVIAVTAVGNFPVASTTVLGGVKVDGTSIQAAGDGTISTVLVPMGDNRIINGDMRIDQRNNGAAGTAINVYTVDRWLYGAAQASKGTWQRIALGSTILPFGYVLSFTSSSAYTPLAGDSFSVWQPIEADAVADLDWGTASAQPITVSFWAVSSLGGTFGGAIRNYPMPSTRSYPFTYTLAAGTWTKIVVTIPGDTAGTWVLAGNAAAFALIFDYGSGSTMRAPAGAWTSGNYVSANGSLNVVGTNGAYLNITGVKLEIGNVATPFNRQSMAKSLADCQRYFQVYNYIVWGGQVSAAGMNFFTNVSYNTVMRAVPTVSFSGQAYNNASGIASQVTNANQIGLSATGTTAAWATASCGMTLNAEL